jgi:hypothetical protein
MNLFIGAATGKEVLDKRSCSSMLRGGKSFGPGLARPKGSETQPQMRLWALSLQVQRQKDCKI